MQNSTQAKFHCSSNRLEKSGPTRPPSSVELLEMNIRCSRRIPVPRQMPATPMQSFSRFVLQWISCQEWGRGGRTGRAGCDESENAVRTFYRFCPCTLCQPRTGHSEVCHCEAADGRIWGALLFLLLSEMGVTGIVAGSRTLRLSSFGEGGAVSSRMKVVNLFINFESDESFRFSIATSGTPSSTT